MTEPINARNTQAFYAAALVGLRALDARERTPRRFGPEIDARWKNFRGHLGMSARLDILVRDAAVTYGAAFSPAKVFRLPGLASDEPFGPDWSGLEDHEADRRWPPGAEVASLDDCAHAWGIEARAVGLPDITPSTRLVVTGGAAILALGKTFAARRELSWSSQVLVIADGPSSRHLAGLVAPLVGAGGATSLAATTEEVSQVREAAGFIGGATVVESGDATRQEREFARHAALGG